MLATSNQRRFKRILQQLRAAAQDALDFDPTTEHGAEEITDLLSDMKDAIERAQLLLTAGERG